jgi:ubiquinone/menaquinone biosynthesis C-methylase UbiE
MRCKSLLVMATLVGCLLLGSQAVLTGQNKDDKPSTQIIYVPTPQSVVDKMLDMAKVTSKDVVFDLGCGDGRVVATAAKKFGAKGVGIDIDPDRIKDSNKTVKDLGVEKLVEIRQGDALNVKDLEKATVVMLYMLDDFMEKLEPIAQKRLPKGARIVTHDFKFPNWQTDEPPVEFQGPERQHTLYKYTVK